MIVPAEVPNGPGVFKISCRVEDRVYLGSSIDARARISAARSELQAGTFHCAELQEAWAQFGPDAFYCYLVGAVDDAGTLRSELQLEMDQHRADGVELFNTQLTPNQNSALPARLARWQRIRANTRAGIPDLTARQLSAFHAKYTISDGCWEWTGLVNKPGYGRFCPNRAILWQAHRLSWALVNGPIPDGHHIHHRCGNRRCVNPDHLEPILPDEHARITLDSPSAKNAAKTHCIHGHQDWGYRKRHDGRSQRFCRTCVSLKNKANSHRVQVSRHQQLADAGLATLIDDAKHKRLDIQLAAASSGRDIDTTCACGRSFDRLWIQNGRKVRCCSVCNIKAQKKYYRLQKAKIARVGQGERPNPTGFCKACAIPFDSVIRSSNRWVSRCRSCAKRKAAGAYQLKKLARRTEF